MRIRIRRIAPPKQTYKRFIQCSCFIILFCVTIGFLSANRNKLQPFESLSSLNFSDVVALNLEQDDPRLVDYVTSSGLFIEAGSTLPYLLMEPQHEDPSEMKIGPLLEYIFGEKTGGTFFEAGAFDGEHHSTTLFVEKRDDWKGLLVEPSPYFQKHLREKHRRAKIVKACLSTKKRAMQVKFLENEMMTARIVEPNVQLNSKQPYDCGKKGKVYVRRDAEEHEKGWLKKNGCKLAETVNETVISVNCLPAYTILLATGYTKLDFFSLDTEGTELKILKTLPLDKLHIKVFRIEVALLKKQEIKEVKRILEDAGYERILDYLDFHFEDDDEELFYIKRKSLLDRLF